MALRKHCDECNDWVLEGDESCGCEPVDFSRITGTRPIDVTHTPAPGGTKHDDGKVPLHLLPPVPLFEIAEVLAYGATKYDAWNWCKGFKASRLFGAMLRHLWAWWAGEDKDPETGLSHLAHAGCCLLFLMDLRHTRLEDDRPKGKIALLRDAA